MKMSKKLSKAYKKLDLQEYKGIVAEAQGLLYFMPVYDYENELIITLNQYSDFEIVKHYYNGRFYGFNVYTRVDNTLRLIDTKDTKKQAEKLIEALKHALKYKQQHFVLPY